MRQINLTNYSVRLRDKAGKYKDVPYEVKDSLIEIMFSRDLGLSGKELLARDDLARKIRDCADGQVILEEEEYKKILTAINTVKGLGRIDVEFVRRILEAPTVEVEEKKPPGKPKAKAS